MFFKRGLIVRYKVSKFLCFLICLILSTNAFGRMLDKIYLKVGVGKIQYEKFKGEIKGVNVVYENTAPKGKDQIYSLGVGYKFTDSIRVDLSFQSDRLKYIADDELDEEVEEEVMQTINTSMMFLNCYYDIYSYKNIVPYIAAGIGLGKNKASHFNIPQHAGSTQKGFIWNLGIGIKYNLNKKFALDFGYRYVNLGFIKTSSFLMWTAGKQALKGYQIMGALMYSF